MNTIGVLLLTAAASTGGLFGKPHASTAPLSRSGAEVSGPAPPGGPIAPGGGAGAGGSQPGRRFPNVRSQVFFIEPTGMKIGWQTAAGTGGERVYLPAQLSVPARYNFTQGYIYRLKLTDIDGRPGLVLYPTIEVAPSTPDTDAFLTPNPIPAVFTQEDFDQVGAGNFVTKVIYLPDPKYQELAVAGVETLVSTRLEPGVNPILEADRRGTILMIIRLGAIDLEMPASGAAAATMAPGAGSYITPNAGPGAAPGMTGIQVTPPSTPVQPVVPVDPNPPAVAPPAPPAPPATPPAANPPKVGDGPGGGGAPVPSPDAPKAGAEEPAKPADAPKDLGSLPPNSGR